MSRNERPMNPSQDSERLPHRVRLPGFLIDEEIGLGEAAVQTAPRGGRAFHPRAFAV
jgi:hypothetical protein